MIRRFRFTVQGRVQGVGFRPFVFTMAQDLGLQGWVRNAPEGVLIEVQGPEPALEEFSRGLVAKLPPLARITTLGKEETGVLPSLSPFSIKSSTAGHGHLVLVSPDIATCADCRRDVLAPANRRFQYAFTNCTNCGPRYSITRSIPYDRRSTSMACFAMCPDCAAEYGNPRDRRFHAQPNACQVCGPELVFLVRRPESGAELRIEGENALPALARLLADGGIAAVKGLGGFHLACDACNAESVDVLRKRKHRPHKPFALMAESVEEAARFAVIGDAEKALLLSPEHPVVLCPLRSSQQADIAPNVSPDTSLLGLMLPYTPLHIVLFRLLRDLLPPSRPNALVMTSGNPGGEPICLGNREALHALDSMADAFLLHNRDILIRVDDSVVRPAPERETLFLRRARGYVPEPAGLAPLPATFGTPCIFGAGAELKNTLCFTKGNDAFVSQHIGDVANLETAAFHREIRSHLSALLGVEPEAVVRDEHPEYLSGKLADEWAEEKGLTVLRLQHHFAHAHAVLAENNFAGRALVLALDGTGMGDDGDLWGGEALLVDCREEVLGKHGGPEHKRLARFAPMDLPGGEAAIREPWRIAHALLVRLGLPIDGPGFTAPWMSGHADAASLIPLMLERDLNCPVSTGCGRLFDAVSALLGLCMVTSYEGQAAIRLEEALFRGTSGFHTIDVIHSTQDIAHKEKIYPCPSRPAKNAGNGLLELDTHALFSAVYEDLARGTPTDAVARRFHTSLAEGMLALARGLAKEHGIRHIGLSGGCLQNLPLAARLVRGIRQAGLIPLTHKMLPPNDACISLGQVSWGRMVYRR